MNDLELLKAAAEIAEIEVHDWRETYLGIPFGWCGTAKVYEISWDPFSDDGDALRLDILTDDGDGWIGTILPDGSAGPEVQIGDDAYAATRRAIVLAAAELAVVNRESKTEDSL